MMRRRLLEAWLVAVGLSALGLGARGWAGWPYPPQDLFGALTQLLGVPKVFQLVHAVFGLGQGGKIFAFLGVTVLWLGGLTLLGTLRPWLGAALLGLALLALESWPAALGYALAFWGLGLAVRALLRPVRAGGGDRRAVLAALGGGSALLVAGGLLGLFRSVGASPAPRVASAGSGGSLPPGVTPVRDFHYVSKNLEAFDPVLSGETWRLKVDGMVRSPATFTLADLKGFPQRTLELTLPCISNPVGGPLISNGIWTGFALSDLLRHVGVGRGARYLVWEAADGYTESLPLGDAFEQDVLLVHSLNGAPLTPKHGFPLRVLIPGRYGMKQPRWITGLRLTDRDEPGYWVRRGWSKTARVEIMSRIDEPREVSPVVRAGTPQFIRGVAFGGLKPITRVEVSTDGGATWSPARLTPPRSRYAWTLWTLPWTPAAGAHEVTVRAYSGPQVQKQAEADALPEGATGWHHFIVTAG